MAVRTARGLAEEGARARIRTDMLGKELAQTGSQLTAVAPCSGVSWPRT